MSSPELSMVEQSAKRSPGLSTATLSCYRLSHQTQLELGLGWARGVLYCTRGLFIAA